MNSGRLKPLFLVLFLILLLPARIEIQDEEIFLNTALNVLHTGSPLYTANGVATYQRYSPIFASLLAGHLALVEPLGHGVESFLTTRTAGLLSWGLVLLFNVIITLLLYLLMIRSLGGSSGFWLAGIASSLTLFYATTLFMDPLLAFLLFLAAVLFAQRRFLPCALTVALLGMLKVTNLIYIPVFVAFLLVAPREFAPDAHSLSRRVRRSTIFLCIAAGIPITFHVVFNTLVRGHSLDFGYSPLYIDPLTNTWIPQGFTHPVWRGLIGFLFSPGKSLFLYSPLTLAGAYGLALGIRRRKPLAIIAASLAGTTLLLYAGWSQWEGGMCFGPRLLLPVIPLLLAGLCYLDLARWRPALVALAACGLVINITARITPIFPSYIAEGHYGTGTSFPLFHNFLETQYAAIALALSSPQPINVNLWPTLFESGIGTTVWLIAVMASSGAILACLFQGTDRNKIG